MDGIRRLIRIALCKALLEKAFGSIEDKPKTVYNILMAALRKLSEVVGKLATLSTAEVIRKQRARELVVVKTPATIDALVSLLSALVGDVEELAAKIALSSEQGDVLWSVVRDSVEMFKERLNAAKEGVKAHLKEKLQNAGVYGDVVEALEDVEGWFKLVDAIIKEKSTPHKATGAGGYRL